MQKYISSVHGNFTAPILTEIFKKLNIKIVFRTANKIQKILHQTKRTKLESKSGIYKIKCSDYDCAYIGQTGRTFAKRFKEHIPGPNQNTISTNYAKHLDSTKHKGSKLNENLKALHICKKGKIMDALEEYEIYKAFKNNENLLNEQLKFKNNIIYNTAIKLNAM